MNMATELYLAQYLGLFGALVIAIALMLQIYNNNLNFTTFIISVLLISQVIIVQSLYDIEDEYFELITKLKKSSQNNKSKNFNDGGNIEWQNYH